MNNNVTELEINWYKDCRLKNWQCDYCKERAAMECEVDIRNHVYISKHYGVYCKDHYDTLIEDLIEELKDPSEPNYEDDLGD